MTPVRIICIGGSTTYGYYADLGESYPAYIEQLLNNHFGNHAVEVLNGGLPGKDTKFFKEYVRKNVADQQFDIIIIDCFYNDFGAFYPFFYDPLKSTTVIDDKRCRNIAI